MVPNGNEKTRDIDSAFLARLVVDQDRTFHTLLTDDLLGLVIPEYFNVRGVEDTVLHGLAGPHSIPADDHVDLLTKFGEVGSLFRGSITGTDNGDRLTFEEESVTNRASGYAVTVQALFRGQAEPFGRSAGSDDNRVGMDGLRFVDDHLVNGPGEIDGRCIAETDIRAKALTWALKSSIICGPCVPFGYPG